MPSIVRAQIAWHADSALPRDALTINPHFQNTGGVFTDEDWDGFADALATSMATYGNGNYQTTVKIYDAVGAGPHFPVGEGIALAGTHTASGWPREVACCLSYYSQQNRAKYRGRLYVPIAVIGSAPALRPVQQQLDKVLALSPLLQNAGGADVDWVLYSRVDGAARPVSNAWVDNEWDTIRSRGLRATTRILGTASE